jgi:tetratricopeptide (TPR) repeat protein
VECSPGKINFQMDEEKKIANYSAVKYLKTVLVSLFFLVFAMAQFQCGNQELHEPVYLNHDTAVHYVGMDACKSCHMDIYKTFIQTGMGQSFAPATRQKSAANYKHTKPVYDATLGLYYLPIWIGDSLFVKEFQLGPNHDTIHQRIERVDYIIGSGQHTNSHLNSQNGYLYQLPLTWYSQLQKWDLPPGFEKGRNVRFSREIGLECMSCHNAIPQVADKNSNLFTAIPNGIDCERCHGPGELHVKERLTGTRVDTSKGPDYTIVNPKRLGWERQTDLCQRCHLQGNAILKPGKQFTDFRPGQKLADYFNVFMPTYTGDEQEMIMASHAQRLQQSKCFIKSNPTEVNKDNSLLKLTCINCHNPHVSVKQTGVAIFNQACLKCHQPSACNEIKQQQSNLESQNCVSCHMPKSGTIDIPHVTVHDHKIAIPASKMKLKSLKKFMGLYCVTKGNLNSLDQAQAYLNYAEKFEGSQQIVLDSALYFLNQLNGIEDASAIQIHYLFLKSDAEAICKLAETFKLNRQTDAWMAYRVGQSYFNLNQFAKAISWLEKATQLSQANLKMQIKLGAAYLMNNQIELGIGLLKKVIATNATIEDAWTNLGYGYALQSNFKQALNCYNQEIRLNPFHQQALLNRAAAYLNMGDQINARKDLLKLKQIAPRNEIISQLLSQIN